MGSEIFVSECSNGMRSTYFEWISLLGRVSYDYYERLCVCYSVCVINQTRKIKVKQIGGVVVGL